MLTPRKNPLVDQPLLAIPTRSCSRMRKTLWLLVALITLVLLIWFLLTPPSTQQGAEANTSMSQSLGTMVRSLADSQFKQNLNAVRDDSLSERLKRLEAERLEMQNTILSLEKLVQGMRMEGWLRGASAKRIANGEIEYEILLSNPHVNDKDNTNQNNRAGSISITVRGVDQFNPDKLEVALAHSAQRFKRVNHRIKIPEASEAIKGQLASRVSNFLIITVIPRDDARLAEVRILPISDASRNP
jgi:hypothetical protein